MWLINYDVVCDVPLPTVLFPKKSGKSHVRAGTNDDSMLDWSNIRNCGARFPGRAVIKGRGPDFDGIRKTKYGGSIDVLSRAHCKIHQERVFDIV